MSGHETPPAQAGVRDAPAVDNKKARTTRLRVVRALERNALWPRRLSKREKRYASRLLLVKASAWRTSRRADASP
ncbi:hypothetical protein NSND_62587 [Nitrospira sp. ND1]|nr:hypothetical protein NSND_62587 [Nitrospira sp. ND1]